MQPRPETARDLRPANRKNILMSRRNDQPRARALALEDGIRRDGCAVVDELEFAVEVGVLLFQGLLDALDAVLDSDALVFNCGGHFCACDETCWGEGVDVCECAADVCAEAVGGFVGVVWHFVYRSGKGGVGGVCSAHRREKERWKEERVCAHAG
ncbi:hypothetical protein BJX68DRAFT_247881 [Aspergillus pseudodeflectus]|uniref:Uncharacterized protein n=1 Tax=Aspergillus pseudodeflectus TaxID=176178 RepID=A0ABR4JGY8_9EURO